MQFRHCFLPSNGKTTVIYEVVAPGSGALLSGSPYSSPCLCSGVLDISTGYRKAATETAKK